MDVWDPFSEWGPGGPKRFDMVVLLELLVAVLAVILLLDYAPGVLGIILLVLLALAALALVHVVVTVLRVQWRNRWGPTRSVAATVARKWTQGEDYTLAVPVEKPFEVEDVFRLLQEEMGVTLPQGTSFWVAFLIGDREEELAVPESVYLELEEGTEGALTYRGERLLGFAPLDRPVGPGEDEAAPGGWTPGPHLSAKAVTSGPRAADAARSPSGPAASGRRRSGNLRYNSPLNLVYRLVGRLFRTDIQMACRLPRKTHLRRARVRPV